jgi:precorrin-2 dehydrogenase/sirohydrochlorin ferrochelatase
MKPLYAMMVDITGRRCLVVGGGAVAERKAASLLEAGALVKVVSPSATSLIQKWALLGRIEWKNRPYTKADGIGCFLVIAATDNKQVNQVVYRDAKARGQWINVVDQPELCNFTVPSTVKRGPLQIAISTGGASPSLAKKIRQDLEESFGEEYEIYLRLLQEMREKIRAEVKDPKLRYTLMKELVSDEWLIDCRLDPEGVREKMYGFIQSHTSVQA